MTSGKKKRRVPLIGIERIESSIFRIRGQRVMMFQLSPEELEDWRSQIVTSNPGARMGLRRPPYAFTEHGVAMLSSVLRSERAVQVNIQIMRAFVRVRDLVLSHGDLARMLDELEKKWQHHEKNFAVVFDAIRQLLEPGPERKKPRIGFER